MNRVRVLAAIVSSLLVAAGCAQILGAEFDGATFDAGGAPGVDAGPDADGGADAGPSVVDPRSFEGLALWLSADVGVVQSDDGGTGTISLWQDRSGKGHVATSVDSRRQPLLLRDAAASPVVGFDRAQKTCLTSAWAAAGAPAGLTLFVVSRGDATNIVRFGPIGAVAFPWNANYDHSGEPVLELLVSTVAGGRDTLRLGSAGGAWEVLSARLAPHEIGGIRTFRNGQLAEQASLFDADLPALDALTLGCAPGADEFATAMVGEILVYTEALSDADRRLIEEYLRAKWQVP